MKNTVNYNYFCFLFSDGSIVNTSANGSGRLVSEKYDMGLMVCAFVKIWLK